MSTYHRGLPPRSRVSQSRSPGRSLRTSSTIASSGPSPFEMMHVSVSVEVLEGLAMDCKVNASPAHGFDPKITAVESMDNFKKSNSSSSVPVTAIVSYFKNVSSNQKIATHIPSMPLGTPSLSKGNKKHFYLVRWPTDFDPMGDALSTFRFSRLMRKRESNYDNMVGHIGIVSNSKGFIAEEIKLQIGLMRGSEILTLGVANLVITGDEEEEVIMDIPIIATKDPAKDDPLRSPSPLKRTGSKLFGNSSKTVKKQSFPSDPKRKYKLDENAFIRLHVRAIPESAMTSSSYSSEDVDSEVNENYYPEPVSSYYVDRPPKVDQHPSYTMKKSNTIQRTPSRLKNTLRSSENVIKKNKSIDIGRAPLQPQEKKLERHNSFAKSRSHLKHAGGKFNAERRSQSNSRGEMKYNRSMSKDYSSGGSKSSNSKYSKRSSSEKKRRSYEEPVPAPQNPAAWLIESINNIAQTSFAPTSSGESEGTDDYYEKQRAYRDRRYQRRSKSYSTRSISDSEDEEDFQLRRSRSHAKGQSKY